MVAVGCCLETLLDCCATRENADRNRIAAEISADELLLLVVVVSSCDLPRAVIVDVLFACVTETVTAS